MIRARPRDYIPFVAMPALLGLLLLPATGLVSPYWFYNSGASMPTGLYLHVAWRGQRWARWCLCGIRRTSSYMR